jgi:TniQ
MEEWWKEQEAHEERKKRQQQRKQESDARLQELLPLPQRSEPQDWEDLPSLLSRVGRSMNYENARWVLHPQNVSRGIAPAALPRLHLRADYLLLARLLHLEEEQIYQLTLHRFASRFEQTPTLLSLQMATSLERAGLRHDACEQFFGSDTSITVCPCCLDEGKRYDRLYWRCRFVLYCPRHRIFLVRVCPKCRNPIPAFRPSPTVCPSCKTGDYRTALLPLAPEDSWLEPSHATLLRQLGIDQFEFGDSFVSKGEPVLNGLPPWDYFQVVEACATFLKPAFTFSGELSDFLRNIFPFGMSTTRLSEHLQIASDILQPSLFAHYLMGRWPYHLLIFLERLERVLQEEFRYARESHIIQQWMQKLVQKQYWCVSAYRNDPVAHLKSLVKTYTKTFDHLLPAEKVEEAHGGAISNEYLVVQYTERIRPLREAMLPYPWESLPSLLARAARWMGYRRTEGIWQAAMCLHQDVPASEHILRLRRLDAYRSLEQTLHLDEATLYALTLHRMSSVFEPPTKPNPPTESRSRRNVIDRQCLTTTARERHCLPPGRTKICPACLEETPAYERLYWNIQALIICPQHRLLLVDHCPRCQRHIPVLRRTALCECQFCLDGDYRAAKRLMLPSDSFLYQSQLMLLHVLGVDDPLCQATPSLFTHSLLEELKPWQYFDLLFRFGSLFPHLRPERTLRALRQVGTWFDDTQIYQAHCAEKMARQVSLFHAIFVPAFDHLHPLFNACSALFQQLQQAEAHANQHFLGLQQLFQEELSRIVQERLLKEGLESKSR